ELKNISLKNFQFLIYEISKFILENYFELVYIKEIFDNTFFEGMIKFPNKNKFKYINNLIDIIQNKLKDHMDKEMVSEYSYNLLNVFSNDSTSGISPQSYKNFFLFLFNNLSEELKTNFITSFTSDIDEDDLEEYQYKTTVLRMLLTSTIEQDLKD